MSFNINSMTSDGLKERLYSFIYFFASFIKLAIIMMITIAIGNAAIIETD